ncbi:MAG: tRNA guanosine(34) transglycosylase Tgt [Ruminococcaceae bacterium]|nr:tRNA guanosine(34) transglycosylase Tgt [Oscillospiraceae bacterium]
MYKLISTSGKARLGRFETPHGTVETPAFMNVATGAAIKGGLSAIDLADIGCQVMLCNTYHLHLRPGDELIARRGGLLPFTGWQGPVLTDSGGFQVFSLSKLRKIDEKGVSFQSHIDGRRIFMGPEESMQIQANLGSTIAMAFDECVENPAEYAYVKESSDRTVRWLQRCQDELARLKQTGNIVNPQQMLFGINQGGCYDDIRLDNMKAIAAMDLDGYAIGGLAVGEPAEEMYRIITLVEPEMPREKIRYLMGVGTPDNILQAVNHGIDLFDCVMPSRNARHGQLFTWQGVININNLKYAEDDSPIEDGCDCPTCCYFSRAYLRHLQRADEALGKRLAVLHNLYFYNQLMQQIRETLAAGRWDEFYNKYTGILDKRI